MRARKTILFACLLSAGRAFAAPPWTTVADTRLSEALKKLDQQTNRISKIGSSCNQNFTPKVPSLLSANQKFRKLVGDLQQELRKVEKEGVKKMPDDAVSGIDACTGAFRAAITELDGRIRVLHDAQSKIAPFGYKVKEEVTDPLRAQLSVNSDSDWRLSLYCPTKQDFKVYVANFTDSLHGGAGTKSNAYHDAVRVSEDAIGRISADILHLQQPLEKLKARAYDCR